MNYRIDDTLLEQGTLVALTSFSEGKQVDKVKSAALLSPIAYLNHMTTALGVLAARAFVGEVHTYALPAYFFHYLTLIYIEIKRLVNYSRQYIIFGVIKVAMDALLETQINL